MPTSSRTRAHTNLKGYIAMKKKIIALALVLCMVAVAVVGGTLAYFTADDSATNTFTVGNVTIDLVEEQWDAVGEKEAEDAYPGEPLAKDPKVINKGANPCFVRISVSNLDQFVEKYGDGAMIDYRTNYVVGQTSEDWTYHTDGYFYYEKVLGVDETTSVVFDSIVIPVEVENSEEALPIEVIAQAVQAQGARPSFSAVKAMTVAEIAEWFDTCGMNAQE